MPSKSGVPEGQRTVTPYLTVREPDALLAFVQRVFDAELVHAFRGGDGTINHADVRLGDSHVMIGGGGPDCPPSGAQVHVYLADCDAAYRRALAAGATSVREPALQLYGDRTGGVRDPSGTTWWLATNVETPSAEEIERRMKAAGR
jgi:PhnB protein